MSFVVAFVALGLWVLARKKLGRFAEKLWFVPPAMLLIASASLANTILGIWAAKAIRALLGFLGGLVHTPGTLIAGGLGLLLLVGTVLDLKDKKPDGIAKTGLITLPILALVATGPLAANGSGLFDAISAAANHSLGSMIGG